MIPLVASCLKAVSQPRFFETERGFQGAFLAHLHNALPKARLPGGPIIEQEYQKRVKEHGINIRPDIIIHVPTPKGGNRRQGNFVVFELKTRADVAQALEDFESLDSILRGLDYPIGVFVNIADGRIHAEHYKGPFAERIHCFAIELTARGVKLVHARPGAR